MPKFLPAALLAVALLVPTSALAAPAPVAHAKAHTQATATATAKAQRAKRAATRAALAKENMRNPVTTATAIAESYWGAVPCGGQIAVVANAPLAPGLTADSDGWVTFQSSLGANDLDAPASTYTDCTITLAHWQWANWTDMESDWGMFCLTVTHEMGHLLGYKHTLVPGSVMNPVFTNDDDVPAVCNAAWLPQWRPSSIPS